MAPDTAPNAGQDRIPTTAAPWWRVLHAKAWLSWRLTVVLFTRGLRATPQEMQALIDGHDVRINGG